MSKLTTHQVVSGDTLYSLAKKYGSTVNELKAINGLTSDLIKVGQILDLVKSSHTVVSGDTLFSLAKKYGTTVDNIKSINGLTTDIIKVGQVLKLKDVLELYWSYGDEETRLTENVSRHYTDLNLHIVTKGYKTGDCVDAVVEYDTETGQEQFTVIGIVANNGIATIKNVFDGSEQIITGE